MLLSLFFFFFRESVSRGFSTISSPGPGQRSFFIESPFFFFSRDFPSCFFSALLGSERSSVDVRECRPSRSSPRDPFRDPPSRLSDPLFRERRRSDDLSRLRSDDFSLVLSDENFRSSRSSTSQSRPSRSRSRLGKVSEKLI